MSESDQLGLADFPIAAAQSPPTSDARDQHGEPLVVEPAFHSTVPAMVSGNEIPIAPLSSAGTLSMLTRSGEMQLEWPGNIRQLENAVYRAVVMSDSDQLGLADFPQAAAQSPPMSESHNQHGEPLVVEPAFHSTVPAMVSGNEIPIAPLSSAGTLSMLTRSGEMQLEWPGNIRQLENAVYRAVVMSDSDQLGLADFPQAAAQSPPMSESHNQHGEPLVVEPAFHSTVPAMVSGNEIPIAPLSSAGTLSMLTRSGEMQLEWPGNIRQLENAVYRAVVMSDSDQLGLADFPQAAAQSPPMSESHNQHGEPLVVEPAFHSTVPAMVSGNEIPIAPLSSAGTLSMLTRSGEMQLEWPGNIRQLENAVYRAVVMSDSDQLGLADFPQAAAQSPPMSESHNQHGEPLVVEPAFHSTVPAMVSGNEIPIAPLSSAGTLSMLTRSGEMRPLEEMETEIIRFAISHYRGQMSEVARRLKIGRSTLS